MKNIFITKYFYLTSRYGNIDDIFFFDEEKSQDENITDNLFRSFNTWEYGGGASSDHVRNLSDFIYQIKEDNKFEPFQFTKNQKFNFKTDKEIARIVQTVNLCLVFGMGENWVTHHNKNYLKDYLGLFFFHNLKNDLYGGPHSKNDNPRFIINNLNNFYYNFYVQEFLHFLSIKDISPIDNIKNYLLYNTQKKAKLRMSIPFYSLTNIYDLIDHINNYPNYFSINGLEEFIDRYCFGEAIRIFLKIFTKEDEINFSLFNKTETLDDINELLKKTKPFINPNIQAKKEKKNIIDKELHDYSNFDQLLQNFYEASEIFYNYEFFLQKNKLDLPRVDYYMDFFETYKGIYENFSLYIFKNELHENIYQRIINKESTIRIIDQAQWKFGKKIIKCKDWSIIYLIHEFIEFMQDNIDEKKHLKISNFARKNKKFNNLDLNFNSYADFTKLTWEENKEPIELSASNTFYLDKFDNHKEVTDIKYLKNQEQVNQFVYGAGGFGEKADVVIKGKFNNHDYVGKEMNNEPNWHPFELIIYKANEKGFIEIDTLQKKNIFSKIFNSKQTETAVNVQGFEKYMKHINQELFKKISIEKLQRNLFIENNPYKIRLQINHNFEVVQKFREKYKIPLTHMVNDTPNFAINLHAFNFSYARWVNHNAWELVREFFILDWNGFIKCKLIFKSKNQTLFTDKLLELLYGGFDLFNLGNTKKMDYAKNVPPVKRVNFSNFIEVHTTRDLKNI